MFIVRVIKIWSSTSLTLSHSTDAQNQCDGRCYSVYMFLILVNKALWPIGNKIGGARRRRGGNRKE